jgi:DNA-binding transcriptional ArsR family regulator
MVEYNSHRLNIAFSALADPTRRAIVARLATGEHTVGELARPFDMSLAAVSKHVGVLATAGLIVQERKGRTRRCRLNPDALKPVAEWISTYQRFWQGSFDALDSYLKETEK